LGRWYAIFGHLVARRVFDELDEATSDAKSLAKECLSHSDSDSVPCISGRLGTEMGTHGSAVQFTTKRNVEDLISAFPRSIFL